MIILITGQPGAGKTALGVDMLAHDPQFEGRPLFVMGVPDLQIEHTVTPPVAEWTEFRSSPEDPELKLPYFTFPANSVVWVDEAQRVFRPRAAASKVPPEVAAFETHRHTGIDFVLSTQHPGLLDPNIRKLVGKHIHISVTPLGRYRYEWTTCGDPESKASKEVAAREKYKLPKRAFKLYKSSELHTKIKVKIPGYVYMFGIALVGVVGLSYYIYGRIFHRDAPVPVAQKLDAAAKGNPGGGQAAKVAAAPMTVPEYLESRVPRIEGLAHTAPVYDEVTKPVDAPIPVGCIQNHAKKTCRCMDQQGNSYHTTEAMCVQIVNNGLFIDWRVARGGAAGELAAGPSSRASVPGPRAAPVALEAGAGAVPPGPG